jgi:hypothetical protein
MRLHLPQHGGEFARIAHAEALRGAIDPAGLESVP